MKPFCRILFFLLCCTYLLGQSEYFQQEVDYEIQVTLNDTTHSLSGHTLIHYKNQSPDTLFQLYFHLWPNAYRDQSTALAKQLLQQGKLDFYFSKDSQLGYISNLDFAIDGQKANWALDPKNPDIAIIALANPVFPGQKIDISTPFYIKIPASFSRLGHIGQSYQITQWYPKPAVYDREGWHPMPYLDNGEFYSEFGTFEVAIQLPDNYVVGATGVLQEESEKAFLMQRHEATKAYLDSLDYLSFDIVEEAFPPSSTALKTLHFKAENVHDFAWFADKRFKVLSDQVQLPNGQLIETQVLFTQSEEGYWKKAMDYLKRSLLFYSEKVGDYPYPQCTVVQSALSAGGGMEYPMITVIDEVGSDYFLDEVITHEVGHNWFYGILANNERQYAWMDEGINTYYEQRYLKAFQIPAEDTAVAYREMATPFERYRLAYQYQARSRKEQAPSTPAAKFSTNNYWLGAYEKPALAFYMLENYLGTVNFDRAMQAYYQKWQFKHPSPADFQAHLESTTGESLDWLFDGLLGSNDPLDYAIQRVKKEGNQLAIVVKNKGAISSPIAIGGIKDDQIKNISWHQPTGAQTTILLADEDYDQIVIDPLNWTPDLIPQNNEWSRQSLFPTIAPLCFPLLGLFENPKHTNINWMPTYLSNAYDKSMFGLAIYNTVFPYRSLEYALAPMYALGSNSLNGAGIVQYHHYPKTRGIEKLTIGIQGKSFHYFTQTELDYDLKYSRLVPFIRLHLKSTPTSTFSQSIELRSVGLWTDKAIFSNLGTYSGNRQEKTFIHRLLYEGKNQRPLNPFEYRFTLESQTYEANLKTQNYLRASLEGQHQLTYAPDRHLFIRFFTGVHMKNSRRNAGAISPGAFNLASQGFNDYRFEDAYFGRNETTGFISQQITMREGGFKTPIPQGFQLGRSNDYVLALNFKVDLPVLADSPFHIRPYADLGYFHNATPVGQNATFTDQFLWNGGLAIELLDGVIGFYFPFVSSKNLQNLLFERGGYFNRVSFAFDISRGDPRERWGAF